MNARQRRKRRQKRQRAKLHATETLRRYREIKIKPWEPEGGWGKVTVVAHELCPRGVAFVIDANSIEHPNLPDPRYGLQVMSDAGEARLARPRAPTAGLKEYYRDVDWDAPLDPA